VCILSALSKLTKIAAVLALIVYGLASMHCVLEAVPGFDFLKACCFVDGAPSAPKDCDSDECIVESGKYRAEEQVAAAPQPVLLPALLASMNGAQLPEAQVATLVVSESPPELPKVWQFSHRTALPPRAPCIAS